jgi:ATP/maltotriose-dependent transcriptional regulator MalT
MRLSAEIGLARVAIAQGELEAALPRMCEGVVLAQTHGLRGEVVQMCAVYARWLQARGRGEEAAAVWRMASRRSEAQPLDRERWLASARASCTAAPPPATGDLDPLGLEAVLASMNSERHARLALPLRPA